MAENHSAQRPPEVVFRVPAGYESGPMAPLCARCGQPKPDDGNDMHPQCEQAEGADALAALRGCETVPAGEIRAGDRIVVNDFTAEVTDTRRGAFWLTETGHGPGVAIGWRAETASGMLFRAADEPIQRVTR